MTDFKSFIHANYNLKLEILSKNKNYEALYLLALVWEHSLKENGCDELDYPNWDFYFDYSFDVRIRKIYKKKWPLYGRKLALYNLKNGHLAKIDFKFLYLLDFTTVFTKFGESNQIVYDKLVSHPQIKTYLEKYDISKENVQYFLQTQKLDHKTSAKIIIKSKYLELDGQYIEKPINIINDKIVKTLIKIYDKSEWLFNMNRKKECLFNYIKDIKSIIISIINNNKNKLFEKLVTYVCETGNKEIIEYILLFKSISYKNILILCSKKFSECLEKIFIKSPINFSSKTLLACAYSDDEKDSGNIQKCISLHANISLLEEDFIKCLANNNIRPLIILNKYKKLPDFSNKFNKKYAEQFFLLYPFELSSEGKSHYLIHNSIDDSDDWTNPFVRDRLESCCTPYVAIRCEKLHYYFRERFKVNPVNEFYRNIIGRDSINLYFDTNIDFIFLNEILHKSVNLYEEIMLSFIQTIFKLHKYPFVILFKLLNMYPELIQNIKHYLPSGIQHSIINENFSMNEISIWDAIVHNNKIDLEILIKMTFENDDVEMFSRLKLPYSLDILSQAIKYKAKNLCKHISNNL